VKGLLASYRWRRRLVWLTLTAIVVAAAVGVALKWPNTAAKEPGVSNVPLHFDYSPPKSVRLKLHDKVVALAVTRRFIDTAVVRGKNIDESWSLASPEFRAGFTRKQWDSGNMPVVPFPVQEARWKLDYSDVQGVGFQIALIPTQGSHLRAQVFLVDLHAVGAGKQRRWLIDNWQSAPSGGSQTVGLGGGSGGVLSQVTPRLSPLGQRRLSAAWLLVPFGLLSLIVLVPLGIVSVNWYRGHRALRALQRS
jgi:hypothetical protein